MKTKQLLTIAFFAVTLMQIPVSAYALEIKVRDLGTRDVLRSPSKNNQPAIPITYYQELYDNSYESETNTDIVQCDNSSLIEFDVDGNPFMEVQLAKSIDVATPDSISTLVIDEDVVSDQADDLGRYFIMKKGSYRYNPSIGQNGGYHINMERTK